MFWYGNGMSGWGYVLMTIGMVGFWALVIFAVVALVRSLGSGAGSVAPPSAAPPTPEEVLAMRFARGDIDEQEYRRRLETLRTTPSGSDSPNP